ncbi:hypothetical protein HZH68_008193 [Vespula germanica]|uniref:Uncharacterized protein n=1 Tax=Vespula germanica TaxID=30212 RepID=A0A834K938_VESGE|nr:hypothetical protein HZH68_008193 [Vespula germanica]
MNIIKVNYNWEEPRANISTEEEKNGTDERSGNERGRALVKKDGRDDSGGLVMVVVVVVVMVVGDGGGNGGGGGGGGVSHG